MVAELTLGPVIAAVDAKANASVAAAAAAAAEEKRQHSVHAHVRAIVDGFEKLLLRLQVERMCDR